MSQIDLKNEISNSEVEPLLPIEKKLIGFSLGLGIDILSNFPFCPVCGILTSIRIIHYHNASTSA